MDRMCYLAGRWVSDGEQFDVISPGSGDLAGRALRPGRALIDEAVEAAVAAFGITKRMTAFERVEVLEKISRAIEKRKEDFARTISLESGKPLKYSRGEAARAVQTFREAASECSRLYGEVIPLDVTPPGKGRIGLTRYYPVGPVLAITPFNFPLNLVAHKLAPAIAAGCPVVLKPSSETPLTALELAGVIREAGLPGGALSVLPMSGTEAGDLARRGEIRKVTFTGSAEVGWKLKREAWDKKVTLELGGNAAVILHEDWDDMERALERMVMGGYAYSGQVCISVQRILVHNSLMERFLEDFTGRVSALRRGDPLDEKTEIGPMITEKEAERVEAWVSEAVSKGAEVLTGGRRTEAFFEPTVITGAASGMKVVDEEVFGPVTVVSGYDDYGEALKAVNDSRFGLQAGVFTRDIRLVRMAFDELEVGGVVVGDVPTFRVDRMPYGGVKESGVGREGLRWSIREMCEPRLLVLA